MALYLHGKKYTYTGKQLSCADTATGTLLFEKTLADLDIAELHLAPDQQGIIVLFQPSSEGYKADSNLARITLEGEIMWWAELPTKGADMYTEVAVDEKAVSAFSWSCFRCQIDEHTGKIVKKVFTK